MSPASGARILVVDDEPAILRAVHTNLSRHGFQVETAESGGEAIESYRQYRPDLMLLDLTLPDFDGFDVIARVRESSNTPIVVLSVRSEEQDKVKALDLGADDYLTKPFGADELLARIRVALRHAAAPPSGAAAIFKSKDLLVDLEQRRVRVGGKEVHLSPTEYELLKVFIRHPNKVLTDRILLQHVWGPQYCDEGHYLHVYIARLRKKLERDPRRPHHFYTEPGLGYRLLVDEDADGEQPRLN